MCLIQRKKKRRQFGPPVLCRTFSFDPPLLFLLPPTTPPTHTHRDTEGPADLQDITPASLFYLLYRDACFLIYIFTLSCVYVHIVATGRHWGRREGNKEREWQEGSEGGRERGRVRISLKQEKGGGEVYMLVTCLWCSEKYWFRCKKVRPEDRVRVFFIFLVN